MEAPSAKLKPVFAIVGPDRFLRREALQGILAQAGEDFDHIERVEGATAVLAEVLDGVRTMSLLGSCRVVVVDGADPFITAHRAALERYCAEPAPGGCLILGCNSLPKNTRLYRIINEQNVVIHCEPPKGRAVTAWITARARSVHGKNLGAVAAQALRRQIGDSPGLLDAELGKLSAYVGSRPEIAPEDVSALTGHHREEKVFAITDAISSGDTKTALRHWRQVLATDRAAPARAIAGLAWGVRRLLQAKCDWADGTDLRELARRMYVDPGVLRDRLEGFTIGEFEDQQQDLLSADVAIKTGATTADIGVEKFIVKHSERRRTAHTRRTGNAS